MENKSNIAQRLVDLAYIGGGGTLAVGRGMPTRGYLVGFGNLYTGGFPEHRGIQAIQYKIDLSGSNLFGSWRKKGVDDNLDILYIDEVKCFNSLDKALMMAKLGKELAIWDISNEKEIEVNYEK